MSDSERRDDANMKAGRMEITFGKPLNFIESPDASTTASTSSDQARRASAAGIMKAYRDATRALLKDRYQSLAEIAPEHLRLPCNVTVLLCSDGMIVRYEVGEEGKVKVRSAAVDQPLSVFAPRLSDGIVHFPDDFDSYDPGPAGPT